MGTYNTHSKYLYQALDSYPHNLEETIEALTFAISYDENNALALGLLARVHSEQLHQYKKAISLFNRALKVNLNEVSLYPHFINALLWNEDWEQAQKLINYSLQVKGVDKGLIHLKQALLFEYKEQYKKAIKWAERARSLSFNDAQISHISCEIKRIKKKMKNFKE
ncbi:MAG: hypothetical protein ACPG6V_09370 [Flavobacteriales bacterium]